jgi:hypothetical protein
MSKNQIKRGLKYGYRGERRKCTIPPTPAHPYLPDKVIIEQQKVLGYLQKNLDSFLKIPAQDTGNQLI